MAETTRTVQTFNSPIETGIRALILLAASYTEQLDLQRILEFEYMMVHTEDVEGPPSIHPALPLRSGEYRKRILTFTPVCFKRLSDSYDLRGFPLLFSRRGESGMRMATFSMTIDLRDSYSLSMQDESFMTIGFRNPKDLIVLYPMVPDSLTTLKYSAPSFSVSRLRNYRAEPYFLAGNRELGR